MTRSAGCRLPAAEAPVFGFCEVTSFPEVDVLPEPSNPYEVDLNQGNPERPRTNTGGIVVGIVFGAIAASMTSCATYLFGTHSFLLRDLVRDYFQLPPGAERQLVFHSVMALSLSLSCIVAASTFITVFYVARKLKWR